MPPAQRVPAHPPFQYDADNESFVFVAQTGKMAIGDSFTNYHQACKGLNFNRKRCADYLATTGVLLMTPQPTELQKRFFPDYEDLLNLTEGWLTSPSNDDIEDITSRYRSAKDGLTPTQNAKHPDLILRAGSNDLEMGFGEVSGKGVNDVEKDVGDFARLCIWAKKALDTAWIQYEGLDDWQIPFFQVLGSELYMFEDELEEWKSLEDNFLDSLEQLEVAQFSPRQSPAGKVFIGITTPSARVMPTGPRTRRNTSRQ
ncbi:hypothetical protein BGZ65_003063 [Modicella reniformis]|uniref:Uncharacterized protein n=1 Tax=Modicella reniformis TaxID=1440133 RepID=A0A9P6INK1_9FUNG|nr:hypothetical protein BGZ65_003063 [Modicella reniformis]